MHNIKGFLGKANQLSEKDRCLIRSYDTTFRISSYVACKKFESISHKSIIAFCGTFMSVPQISYIGATGFHALGQGKKEQRRINLMNK